MREVSGAHLKDAKRVRDLMHMLGLNETMNRLAMASSLSLYVHVLRRALDIEVKGQMTNGRAKMKWRQVEDKMHEHLFTQGRCA